MSFIPPGPENEASARLMAASGQGGGGMQIVVPFEPSQNDSPANFMLPQLERGESISAMVVAEDNLALGTSQCRILQYKMAGYDATVHRTSTAPASSTGFSNEFVPTSPTRSPGSVKSMASAPPRPKKTLEAPAFVPPSPALSLDPTLLQSENPSVRNGVNDRIKSIFTAYTIVGDPMLANLPAGPNTSFGPLTANPLIVPAKRIIAPQLTAKAEKNDGDYLMTIPTSSLEVDLLENHSTKKSHKHRRNPKKAEGDTSDLIPNPNKTIFAKKIAALCYENLNRGPSSADDAKSRRGGGTVSESVILAKALSLGKCSNPLLPLS